MIKSLKKKLTISSLFLAYILIGSFLSVTTGITSDEYHEQKNWIVNLSAIKDFIYTGEYDSFLEYWDRYHGIAFQLISQPIQFFIKDFITNINNVTDYGGLLISKHFVVFLTFAGSGIFFYLILLKITKDENISLISTTIYLLYPYLFGHAQFNPKDIPFLSFWLITTYFSLKVFENLFQDIKIGFKSIIIFSLSTAFLISIRIAGFLIFIQFFISLLIYLERKKISFYSFLKKIIKI